MVPPPVVQPFVQRGRATVGQGSPDNPCDDRRRINRGAGGLGSARWKSHPRVKGLGMPDFELMNTLFGSRYSWIASTPFSRPSPEFFTPPKGAR